MEVGLRSKTAVDSKQNDWSVSEDASNDDEVVEVGRGHFDVSVIIAGKKKMNK